MAHAPEEENDLLIELHMLRQRVAQLEQTNARLQTAHGQDTHEAWLYGVMSAYLPVMFFKQDDDLRYVWTHGFPPQLPETDIRGKTDRDVFLPEDASRLAAIKRQALEHHTGARGQFRLAIAGEVVVLDLAVMSVYDETDSNVALVGAALDITEYVHQHETLSAENVALTRQVSERTTALSQAQAEQARTERVKDEFLATISHELRTPLNVILGLSEILLENIYGTLNEKQHSTLQTIEASGRHLMGLINNVLDLSTIEAGSMHLQREHVHVQAICDASLKIVRQQAVQKHLVVSETIDSSVTTVYADGRRLKQMLGHLLSNAIKFTPAGGNIGLEVQADVERETIAFTVWDSGIGIAAEDLEKLFKPFIQLQASLNRPHEGMGIGLVLVERLARLHGGNIYVESLVGQGSRFTLTLPAQAPDEQHLVPKSENGIVSRADENRPPHVLIVEDNQVTAQIFTDYLQHTGYRVSVAYTGTEVIKRARDDTPVLLLLALPTPDIDGLELLRRLRADEHLSAIPIIVLLAASVPGDHERYIEAGANDCINKPVRLKHLKQLITLHVQAVRNGVLWHTD